MMGGQNFLKIISFIISLKFLLLTFHSSVCLSVKSPGLNGIGKEVSTFVGNYANSTTKINSSHKNVRKKRQDGGGGSTSVIGARITRDATTGDWLTVNIALNNGDSAAPSRGKRSIGNWYLKSTPFDLEGTPKRGKKLTRTQELFSCVNKDYYSARKFQESKEVQGNSYLRQSLVLNQNGVKCHHVCDSKESVGFGLLGFCTERYCLCDLSHGRHVEYICPVDKVFDPVTLWCQSPTDTILCSDPQTVTFYGPPSLLQLWTANNAPTFVHGWKKWK